jgi:hypothetical protein
VEEGKLLSGNLLGAQSFFSTANVPPTPGQCSNPVRIASISVRVAALVDAVIFTFNNGFTVQYGGNGGNLQPAFTLDHANGEYITEFTSSHDSFSGTVQCVGIKLRTSSGRTYEIAGSYGFRSLATYTAPDGQQITGLQRPDGFCEPINGIVTECNVGGSEDDIQNFHQVRYAPSTQAAPAALACLTGAPSFSNIVLSSPFHHTATGPNYTPIVGAFAVDSSAGTFSYIHVPSKASPTVWNGYDSFTYRGSCGIGDACDGRVNINVVFWSARSQNETPSPFNAGNGNVVCDTSKSCTNKNNGMWLSRQTLPRLWDMQQDEAGNNVKPFYDYDATTPSIPADGLDFEWTSNWAQISTYGIIGNMAARFPTFELLTFTPGQNFRGDDTVAASAATLSTGFDATCLNGQTNTGSGANV